MRALWLVLNWMLQTVVTRCSSRWISRTDSRLPVSGRTIENAATASPLAASSPSWAAANEACCGVVHQRADQVPAPALPEVGRRTGVEHVEAGQGCHPVECVQCRLPLTVTRVDDPDGAKELPAGPHGEGEPCHLLVHPGDQHRARRRVDGLEVCIEGRRLDLLQGEGCDAAQLVHRLARQGGVTEYPAERIHDAGRAVGERRRRVGERVEVPEPDPGDGICSRPHHRCPGQGHQPRPGHVVRCHQDGQAVLDCCGTKPFHGCPVGFDDHGGRVAVGRPVHQLVEIGRAAGQADGQDNAVVHAGPFVQGVVHQDVRDGVVEVFRRGVGVHQIGLHQLDAVRQPDHRAVEITLIRPKSA